MRRPRFIAEQARHARGPLGRLVASVMVNETWPNNLRAIDALDIDESDHVLDVGCGPGRSLARMAMLAPKGRVVGLDPSPLMVKIARRKSRALFEEGRLDVVVGSVARLPFADASFDRALCVHVVYFWSDLPTAFGELARVLRPGGRLALVFRTSADETAVAAFPAEVYRFPAPRDVIAPMESAGFAITACDETHEGPAVPPMLLLATRR